MIKIKMKTYTLLRSGFFEGDTLGEHIIGVFSSEDAAKAAMDERLDKDLAKLKEIFPVLSNEKFLLNEAYDLEGITKHIDVSEANEESPSFNIGYDIIEGTLDQPEDIDIDAETSLQTNEDGHDAVAACRIKGAQYDGLRFTIPDNCFEDGWEGTLCENGCYMFGNNHFMGEFFFFEDEEFIRWAAEIEDAVNAVLSEGE